MKLIISFIITLTLFSCNNPQKTKEKKDSSTLEISQDTVLVKIKNELNKSYAVGFYSKSYTYCWTVGQDTLDLKIGVTEYVSDSSVQLRVINREPIRFNKAVDKVNECLPLIRENFELQNLSSLFFEPPIFYRDLTTKLSEDYKNQYGQENIGYDKLDEFLMNSWLEEQIGAFLDQFDKTTKGYGIEKFHLLGKEYYKEYIPNADLNEYPNFSIHGMGISVILDEKKRQN
ncbi:MAG: hypothetical protein Kapaf2KO_14740 [Candidatus Kapaibacteriales bacterium]